MKLTNDVINQAAAELLGYCDGLNLNDPTEKGYCKACGKGVLDDTHEVPDFIHDANAVRELVVWLVAGNGCFADTQRTVEDEFYWFLDRKASTVTPLQALVLSPKTITLAVLCSVGKITLAEAREAMEGDDND